MVKVSVLIPAFNCASYIEQCIQSVLSQSFFDFELLVCDDCSTDNTYSIISSYKQRDSRVFIYKNDENLGKIKTIEKLLHFSKGEYLTILDSDDYIDNNKLKIQVNFLDLHENYSFIASSFKRVSDSGVVTSSEFLHYEVDELKFNILNANPMALCCGSVLCRAKYAKDIGGYNSYFHDCNGEDLDFVARLLGYGLGASTSDLLYYYRYRENSLTRRVFETPRQRHSHEIIAFLFSQRLNNSGKDSLNSSLPGLQDFVISLSNEYFENKGLMKRKIAIDHALNKNYLMAISSAYSGFCFKNLNSSIKTFSFIFIMIFTPRFILLFLKDLFNFKNLSRKL